jgi:hypothetical protein
MDTSTISTIATMPTVNFVVLCATILGVISVLALILNNMGFLQIGSFTVRKNQEGQTTMHSMDEENADTDDLLKSRLRQMTNSLRKRIFGMFGAYPACAMTKRALSSSLRFPLYESIGNNHYTKELMPDKFYEYRRRMLASLEDEYMDILVSISDTPGCLVQNELPAWEEAEAIVAEYLDRWLLDVVGMVSDCSRQKIETYNKYLKIFSASKDKYRSGIAESCIAKNTIYISELTSRASQLRAEIEQKNTA